MTISVQPIPRPDGFELGNKKPGTLRSYVPEAWEHLATAATRRLTTQHLRQHLNLQPSGPQLQSCAGPTRLQYSTDGGILPTPQPQHSERVVLTNHLLCVLQIGFQP